MDETAKLEIVNTIIQALLARSGGVIVLPMAELEASFNTTWSYTMEDSPAGEVMVITTTK